MVYPDLHTTIFRFKNNSLIKKETIQCVATLLVKMPVDLRGKWPD